MGIAPRDPSEPVTAEMGAQLRAAYSNVERIRVAMALARDHDTCRRLYAGDPVDPGRVDPDELENARHRKFVRLDLNALDVAAGNTGEAAA